MKNLGVNAHMIHLDRIPSGPFVRTALNAATNQRTVPYVYINGVRLWRQKCWNTVFYYLFILSDIALNVSYGAYQIDFDPVNSAVWQEDSHKPKQLGHSRARQVRYFWLGSYR